MVVLLFGGVFKCLACLIQITGRHNYTEMSKDLGEDFVTNPELVATPKYAVLSACWFWKVKKLNELC